MKARKESNSQTEMQKKKGGNQPGIKAKERETRIL